MGLWRWSHDGFWHCRTSWATRGRSVNDSVPVLGPSGGRYIKLWRHKKCTAVDVISGWRELCNLILWPEADSQDCQQCQHCQHCQPQVEVQTVHVPWTRANTFDICTILNGGSEYRDLQYWMPWSGANCPVDCPTWKFIGILVVLDHINATHSFWQHMLQ